MYGRREWRGKCKENFDRTCENLYNVKYVVAEGIEGAFAGKAAAC
jgi:hypothetical protein